MKTLKDRELERVEARAKWKDVELEAEREAANISVTVKKELETVYGLWPMVELNKNEVVVVSGDARVSIKVVAPDRYLVAGSLAGAIWPPSEVGQDAMLDAILSIILRR